MITLIRRLIIWYYKTKWECAFWQEFNKQATELVKHPENIEKKLLPFIADLAHNAATLEKQRMKNGTYTEK